MSRPEDKTILIVEDEPDVQAFLQAVLEDAGFNVLVAGDGEEGLKMIREQRPDFVSLDLVLPRKTGHRLLRELKHDKALRDIPVLIVTAHAKDDLGRTMMDDIFDGAALLGPGLYLEKPVKPLQYVRCIQRALGLEESEELSGSTGVKEELRGMIDSADPDALNRALKALRKDD